MTTLTFYGGVETVTGSKYLVETARSRILVDCGLFQGPKALRERNWQAPPFDAPSLDAVVLTHAHIDHSGYLPRLIVEGFRGPIICSRGTAELLRVLLPDAARLQEEEADYRNRHNLTHHRPAKPLYTEQDADRALALLQPVRSRNEPVRITDDIHARFFDAGHILGSRFVALDIALSPGPSPIRMGEGRTAPPRLERERGLGGEGDVRDGIRTILFSGDIGRTHRPILRDPQPPPACDYLLVESTYGDRLHPAEDPKADLARILNDAAKRKGPVLIPAFAIGRTQELLYMIRELEDEKRIPILPVRVDSPMAAEATRAYTRALEEHDEEYNTRLAERIPPLQTHNMRLVSSPQESRSLNEEKGTRVIISASGMMTGGRVLHHALRILPDSNATIVFAGYQGEGTTGRRIVNGESEVKIMKQWTPVRCKVEKMAGMSGHTDWQGVLEWLSQMPGEGPRTTYVTHGETGSAEALQARIKERFGWHVEVPVYGERVEM